MIRANEPEVRKQYKEKLASKKNNGSRKSKKKPAEISAPQSAIESRTAQLEHLARDKLINPDVLDQLTTLVKSGKNDALVNRVIQNAVQQGSVESATTAPEFYEEWLTNALKKSPMRSLMKLFANAQVKGKISCTQFLHMINVFLPERYCLTMQEAAVVFEQMASKKCSFVREAQVLQYFESGFRLSTKELFAFASTDRLHTKLATIIRQMQQICTTHAVVVNSMVSEWPQVTRGLTSDTMRALWHDSSFAAKYGAYISTSDAMQLSANIKLEFSAAVVTTRIFGEWLLNKMAECVHSCPASEKEKRSPIVFALLLAADETMGSSKKVMFVDETWASVVDGARDISDTLQERREAQAFQSDERKANNAGASDFSSPFNLGAAIFDADVDVASAENSWNWQPQYLVSVAGTGIATFQTRRAYAVLGRSRNTNVKLLFDPRIESLKALELDEMNSQVTLLIGRNSLTRILKISFRGQPANAMLELFCNSLICIFSHFLHTSTAESLRAPAVGDWLKSLENGCPNSLVLRNTDLNEQSMRALALSCGPIGLSPRLDMRIERLEFIDVELRRSHAKWLSQLVGSQPTIHSIRLENNSSGKDINIILRAVLLSSEPVNRGLQSLEICNNPSLDFWLITDVMQGMSNLQTLRLCDNALTGEAITCVLQGAMRVRLPLVTVDLSGNPISNKCASDIAKLLPRFELSLRKVIMQRCLLTAVGAAMIIEGLFSMGKRAHELDISDNPDMIKSVKYGSMLVARIANAMDSQAAAGSLISTGGRIPFQFADLLDFSSLPKHQITRPNYQLSRLQLARTTPRFGSSVVPERVLMHLNGLETCFDPGMFRLRVAKLLHLHVKHLQVYMSDEFSVPNGFIVMVEIRDVPSVSEDVNENQIAAERLLDISQDEPLSIFQAGIRQMNMHPFTARELEFNSKVPFSTPRWPKRKFWEDALRNGSRGAGNMRVDQTAVAAVRKHARVNLSRRMSVSEGVWKQTKIKVVEAEDTLRLKEGVSRASGSQDMLTDIHASKGLKEDAATVGGGGGGGGSLTLESNDGAKFQEAEELVRELSSVPLEARKGRPMLRPLFLPDIDTRRSEVHDALLHRQIDTLRTILHSTNGHRHLSTTEYSDIIQFMEELSGMKQVLRGVIENSVDIRSIDGVAEAAAKCAFIGADADTTSSLMDSYGAIAQVQMGNMTGEIEARSNLLDAMLSRDGERLDQTIAQAECYRIAILTALESDALQAMEESDTERLEALLKFASNNALSSKIVDESRVQLRISNRAAEQKRLIDKIVPLDNLIQDRELEPSDLNIALVEKLIDTCVGMRDEIGLEQRLRKCLHRAQSWLENAKAVRLSSDPRLLGFQGMPSSSAVNYLATETFEAQQKLSSCRGDVDVALHRMHIGIREHDQRVITDNRIMLMRLTRRMNPLQIKECSSCILKEAAISADSEPFSATLSELEAAGVAIPSLLENLARGYIILNNYFRELGRSSALQTLDGSTSRSSNNSDGSQIPVTARHAGDDGNRRLALADTRNRSEALRLERAAKRFLANPKYVSRYTIERWPGLSYPCKLKPVETVGARFSEQSRKLKIVSVLAFSRDLLREPLTKVSGHTKILASRVHSSIMSATDPLQRTTSFASDFLKLADRVQRTKSSELHVEIVLQICTQLRGNPSAISQLRAWQLLFFIFNVKALPAAFKPYMLNYLTKLGKDEAVGGMASFCRSAIQGGFKQLQVDLLSERHVAFAFMDTRSFEVAYPDGTVMMMDVSPFMKATDCLNAAIMLQSANAANSEDPGIQVLQDYGSFSLCSPESGEELYGSSDVLFSVALTSLAPQNAVVDWSYCPKLSIKRGTALRLDSFLQAPYCDDPKKRKWWRTDGTLKLVMDCEKQSIVEGKYGDFNDGFEYEALVFLISLAVCAETSSPTDTDILAISKSMMPKALQIDATLFRQTLQRVKKKCIKIGLNTERECALAFLCYLRMFPMFGCKSFRHSKIQFNGSIFHEPIIVLDGSGWTIIDKDGIFVICRVGIQQMMTLETHVGSSTVQLETKNGQMIAIAQVDHRLIMETGRIMRSLLLREGASDLSLDEVRVQWQYYFGTDFGVPPAPTAPAWYRAHLVSGAEFVPPNAIQFAAMEVISFLKENGEQATTMLAALEEFCAASTADVETDLTCFRVQLGRSRDALRRLLRGVPSDVFIKEMRHAAHAWYSGRIIANSVHQKNVVGQKRRPIVRRGSVMLSRKS
eukprot:g3310.t1